MKRRYIDLDKAISLFHMTFFYSEKPISILECVPLEDVAPVVHGSWIKDDNEQCYCSACMDDHHRPMFFTPHSQWRYCPWCGAKMDEAEIVGKRMIDGLIDGMGNNVKSVGQQFCNGEE